MIEIRDPSAILEEAMLHLVQMMRHFLGNIHEEQFAITQGHGHHLPTILMKRTEILNELAIQREKMSSALSCLANTHLDISLEQLASVVGDDKVNLLFLRDQVLALAASIEKQNDHTRTLSYAHPKPYAQEKKSRPLQLALLDPEPTNDRKELWQKEA